MSWQDIGKALSEPFDGDHIEWRVQRSGKGAKGAWAIVVPYVTNRAIMDRLDATVGPGNWKNEYQRWGAKGVLCGLSLRLNLIEDWVTKWDGADETDIESTKGGLSAAMKRAAVQWGMGRHLYELTDTMFAPPGSFEAKEKGDKTYVTITDPAAISARYLGGSKPPKKPKPKKEKNPVRSKQDWSDLIAGATTMEELTAIGQQLGDEADVLDLDELRLEWKARRTFLAPMPRENDAFDNTDDGSW